jgi:hypothetical protein
MSLDWRVDEILRRHQVEAGRTVVAHCKRDAALVEWAKSEGIYSYIGRPGRWGNPYVIGRDGDRDAVCDVYAAHLRQSAELLKRLPDLRGAVLGCWCYPKRCHGNEIIRVLGEQCKKEAVQNGGTFGLSG